MSLQSSSRAATIPGSVAGAAFSKGDYVELDSADTVIFTDVGWFVCKATAYAITTPAFRSTNIAIRWSSSRSGIMANSPPIRMSRLRR